MHVIHAATSECLEQIRDFLRTAHVQVYEADGETLRVSIPRAVTPLHERREIDGYVRTWNALNPACIVTLVAA